MGILPMSHGLEARATWRASIMEKRHHQETASTILINHDESRISSYFRVFLR